MRMGKFFGWGVAALVLVALVAIVTVYIMSPQTFAKPYSVISSASGFYVGRVYNLPFSSLIKIKDAYILNNLTNDQNQLVRQQLTSVADNSLWGSGTIYLNRDQVIFKSKVERCSAIDRTLRDGADGTIDNKIPGCPDLPAPEASPAPVTTPPPAPSTKK